MISLIFFIPFQYGGILQYSNVTIIWLFLTLVAITTTAFCFLLSVFFSKAKLAAACGGIVYFLTYMPYVFISIREGGAHINISAAWKMFASLLSTTAFGLGARYFALFEQNGSGVQWSNVASSPVRHCNLFKCISFYLSWYCSRVSKLQACPPSYLIVRSLTSTYVSSESQSVSTG